jgi:copper chaperone
MKISSFRKAVQTAPRTMLQLNVSNMACSACAETITQAVTALDPTAKVKADLQTKEVSIETQVAEDLIKQAIATAGYTAT